MIEDKHKLPMNSGRLETLGDGIFSIAMTILVLELELPDVKGNSWHDFTTALHETGYGLMCYVISFIVLGIMWFGHRLMFEYIGRSDRYFIFLGVLFYMVVCLVPFSTRLLAKDTFEWYAILVYGLNLSLCNITLYSQWLYGTRKPHMLHREIPAEIKKEAHIQFLLSPVVYAIAIIVSFYIPWISIGIFIITPILYLIPSKLDKYLP
ncbi:MAG TPA: TMEM175 family protein [Chitinophagaceae bacterium]|nr:TMEM175 family protein [Chitinophagaceae bacterium]